MLKYIVVIKMRRLKWPFKIILFIILFTIINTSWNYYSTNKKTSDKLQHPLLETYYMSSPIMTGLVPIMKIKVIMI